MNHISLSTRIYKRTFGYLPYFICLALLFSSRTFGTFTLANLITQFMLFVLVVNIPAYFTKRMSNVDIGWPWGLVAIGVIALVVGEGYWLRKLIISGMYLAAGLRMGVLAVSMLLKGHLKKELPRYEFQRKRWEKGGYRNLDFSLQYEISLQGIANMTFLALPAIFQAYNPTPSLAPLEVVGYSLWFISLLTEHIADIQKARFAKKAYREGRKGACCDVGLWKYSRHPNYFAEWMVWNSLIISTISSIMYFYQHEQIMVWTGLALGTLFISKLLYQTLVYYTGAIPAEYYSLQKRPQYKEYQKRTNMFFPGKPRS